MNPLICESLARFTPITLEALNGKAAMLERLDNKYIVPAIALRPAFDALSEMFDVLEIDGKRSFVYATRYFDDDGRRGYYDHHQGRRKRCKVRVRDYVDAGFSYLEVKLKDKRSITVKKRLRLDGPLRDLDRRCMDFVDDCHRKQYGAVLGRPLRMVIGMRYQRITLVAKEGGERLTIDTRLHFEAGERVRDVSEEMFIVETKSAHGNGIADKIMRLHHLQPTKRCSKYCLGMAALGQVRQANRFLPALRRLRLVGHADIAAPEGGYINAYP
ncbi:MAG: VTC domain-containing protein [Tropicimonas sp.]|uniref:VTC domain-containing protein n=1 Tax=Tropicimonas sp. TaxID=2067044 RepID=UPI003A83AF6E